MCEDYYWRMSGFYPEYYTEYYPEYYPTEMSDEYFPIKEDRHKETRTLRFRAINGHDCWWSAQTNCSLYKNNNLYCSRILNNDEIPITVIDDYFKNTFDGQKSFINEHGIRAFNKKLCWKKKNVSIDEDDDNTVDEDKSKVEDITEIYDLDDALEQFSIQTIKCWDNHRRVVDIQYNVPVTGVVYRPPEDKNSLTYKAKHWLYWNRKYYDPNYIYKYFGDENDTFGKLTKYCPDHIVLPKIEHSSLVESQHLKDEVYYNMTKNGYFIKDCISSSNEYIKIDLGSVRNITAIVTYGEYPSYRNGNVRIFPKKKEGELFYTHVGVLEGSMTNNYVTRYSVEYKDTRTNTWKHYDRFNGNINAYTSKYNLVNIYARHIRITPIDFVGKKIMSVYVYAANNRLPVDDKTTYTNVVKYTKRVINKELVCDGRAVCLDNKDHRNRKKNC